MRMPELEEKESQKYLKRNFPELMTATRLQIEKTNGRTRGINIKGSILMCHFQDAENQREILKD
jgi:hypothetical protein